MLYVYKQKLGMLKSISKDALYIWPSAIVKLLTGFLVSIMLGRYLEPDEYGVYISCFVVVTYITLIVSGWLQNSIVRYVSENNSLYTQYLNYSNRVILLVVSSSFLLVFSLSFSSVGNFSLWLGFSTYLVGLVFFSVTQSLLRASFDRKHYSLGMIYYSFLVLFTLSVISAADEISVSSIALGLGACHLVVGVYQYVYLPKREKRQKYYSHSIADSLRYAIPITFVSFMTNFLVVGDKLVIAMSGINMHDVGVYGFWTSVGIQVSRGANSLLFAIITPWIFRIWGENQVLAIKYIAGFSCLYIVGAVIPFYLVGCLAENIAIYMAINEEYLEFKSILFVSIYSGYALGVSQLIGKVFELLERTHVLLYILLLQGFLISFVSFVYASQGVYGVSLYVLFVVSVGALVTFLFSLSAIRLRYC